MHVIPVCPPESGKVVAVLWLKDDGFQAVVVWHVLQSVENLAAKCPGLVVAL
jgi:hypothetical protein